MLISSLVSFSSQYLVLTRSHITSYNNGGGGECLEIGDTHTILLRLITH